MDSRTTITSEVLVAYVKCPLKAYYLHYLPPTVGSHAYMRMLDEKTRKVRTAYFEQLKLTCPEIVPYSVEARRKDNPILLEAVLDSGDMRAYADALLLKNNPSKQHRAYQPVLVIGVHKTSKDHKLHLAFIAHVLSKLQKERPTHGFIVTATGKAHQIKVDNLYQAVALALRKIRDLAPAKSREPPPLVLNKECPYCPFQEVCKAKAKETDNLSLLQGMSKKEVEDQNKKGIFTITQFSYTYRPRRPRKGKENDLPKYSHSLKALAIRDNKTYVVERSKLQLAQIRIFLDKEGIPDRDFYYLIGLIVVGDGSTPQNFSYWANDENAEETIWQAFLSVLRRYNNFTLLHYGSYESKFIVKMIRRYQKPKDVAIIKKISKNMVNVLSVIYARYYFPTYSNGLKDIGTNLGAQWSEKKATGLQSLIWRHDWEHAGKDHFKDTLIQYNLDDCLALCQVTQALTIREGDSTFFPGLECEQAPEAQNRYSQRGYCVFKSTIPHFEKINQYAYFDYQRDKVYLKTNKSLPRPARQGAKRSKTTGRANETKIIRRPKRCYYCGHPRFYQYSRFVNRTIDLKFLKTGLKRWITRYTGNRVKCRGCGKHIKPRSAMGFP
jgi:predicted RecB family nuclease